MAHHTATAEIIPTDLQRYTDDAATIRLYLDLGLGETAPVQTKKWDWFKQPVELSAEVGSLVLAQTAQPELVRASRLEPIRYEKLPKHGVGPGRATVNEIIDRTYGQTLYNEVRKGLEQIHAYHPEMSVKEHAFRVGGFTRGMIESIPYRQPSELTPLERLEREEKTGEYVLFAPQTELGVAPHKTLPELRVLNSRHNQPRDPEADARLVPLGMAHRPGLKARLRQAVDKPLVAVRNIFGKRKRAEAARQMAEAIELEKQWLAEYDKNYSSDSNPFLPNDQLGTNPFLKPVLSPRQPEDAFIGELAQPAETTPRSRHGTLDDIGFGHIAY